nr:hypothetical protein [Chamaesiphon sp. VAR_48_metabat_135_sub]
MTISKLANDTYAMTDRERQNLSQTIDYSQINSIPEMWSIVAVKCGSVVALNAPHNKP